MKESQTIRTTAIAVATACSLLSACGGGGGGSQIDPAVNDTSTDDLKQAALANIGSGLNTASTGAGDVVNNNAGTLQGTPVDGLIDPPDENGDPVDVSSDIFSAEARSLVGATMALDDADGNRTTRSGTRVTIDPDPVEVCAEDFLDAQADQQEQQRCETLVEDITVQLDVTSPTAGTVSYFFREQPLMTVGYDDNSDSFELDLGGWQRLTIAEAELLPANEQPDLPSTLDGAIKVTSTVTDDTFGAEAGSLSLAVTRAITASSEEIGADISIAASQLLSMAVDAGAGTGNIDINIGQLDYDLNAGEGTQSFDLAGLTASMDLNQQAESFVVSNFGLGRGPLVIALDSEEVLRMTMETFGFSVSEENGSILIDGNLDISMFVKSQFGEGDSQGNFTEYTMTRLLELQAPTGTEIAQALNGALRVDRGGPLSYSLTSTTDDETPIVNSITVEAGQCAEDIGEDEYQLVTCVE
jgi:hypothetical protein